jgi:hypothetical protein
MQQSNDLRSRISKDAMTRIFEQSWSILQQYDRGSLDYFWRKTRSQLEDAVFDNKYMLQSNGSVDGYSREREIQKLMQLRQLAQGSPWIKQNEIDRKIIELMDAQWIDQIYQPPQDAESGQQEEQAIENSVMVDGFLPEVKTDDAHVVHLQMLEGYLMWRPQHGLPQLAPDVMSIFMQHGLNHCMTAKADSHYMKQYGVQINQFLAKIQATQKQMMAAQQAAQAQGQAQQQAQGRAQQSMATLRGGSGRVPPGPPPPPGPGMPPPPGPPPGGIPPNPTNGNTPGP